MHRHLFATAFTTVFLTSSLLTSPSHADIGSVYVQSLVTDEIVVQSNGSSYHRLAPLSNLIANVHVDVDAGQFGRVVWFTAWLGLGLEGVGRQYWPQYREDGYHKSFGNDRPRSWSGTVPVTVPGSSLQTLALGQCNSLAQNLRAGGLGDKAVFAEDRRIELAVTPHLAYEMTGAAGSGIPGEALPSWDDHRKVTLVCQKWPGAVPLGAADGLTIGDAEVEHASLSLLEQYGPSGLCKIVLSGVIQTDRADTEVRFRYKNQEGRLSEVHSVTTDHARTAMFSHQYRIKNNYDAEHDVDWAESGFVRIVGVSHDFRTPWAEYTMECVEPGATDFQTVLRPEVKMQVVELEKVMVGRQLCVDTIRLYGMIVGRGPAAGYAGFVGNGYLSKPEAYAVQQGDVAFVVAERKLNWQADPQATLATGPSGGGLKRQTLDLAFNVTGESGAIIASVPKRGYEFACVDPAIRPDVAGGGGLTLKPRPQDGARPAATAGLTAESAATAPRRAVAPVGGQTAVLTLLPDLVIQRSVKGKGKARLRVLVVNRGAGPAAATSLRAIYRKGGGQRIRRSVAVPALKAGAKAWVVVDFQAPVKKARKITLRVDDPNRVAEQDEANNKALFGG